MHISATEYLEKGAPCFTKVTRDEEMIEDGREAETVSDSEEENKKKGLYVKRRETRGLYHLQPLLRLRLRLRLRLLCLCHGHPLLSTLPSASGVLMPVPGSSALLSSDFPSASGVSVPVSGSSALLLSALPSTSDVSMPVPGLSALSSMSFMSGVSVLVPRSSAPPSMSDVPVPVPGLSSPPFLIWSDPQTPTPVPGRQRLS